jgi:hypothetical protein
MVIEERTEAFQEPGIELDVELSQEMDQDYLATIIIWVP